MIIRSWTADTTPEREAAYLEQVRTVVLPHLRKVPGYLGSQFLRKHGTENVQILVHTYWTSMEAVAALAGENSSTAYLPQEIAATLDRYDPEAIHYELMIEDKTP